MTAFSYQKNNRFFAQIADGLESAGIEELRSFGARECKPAYRGIHFSADLETLYKANYCSRLCTRILAPLLHFDCHSTKYLYQTACKIDWRQLLDKKSSFAVAAIVRNSKITHSHYAALCIKDAIVDSFRKTTGTRPNVDTRDPDVQIQLYLEKNKATISLDTSRQSLHRRGYRLQSVEAPMLETLAAAIIRLTGWQGETPLYDPMCGSGTLLCEAYMLAAGIPAGILKKKFGFEAMPEHNQVLWKKMKNEMKAKMLSKLPQPLFGNDLSPKALKATRTNLAALPGGSQVTLTTGDFRKLAIQPGSVIVCNPPYGIRIGKRDEAGVLIGRLGDYLKQQCKGSSAFLFLGEKVLLKSVGLKPAWKKPLRTGGLDGVLAKYELY